MKFSFIVLLFLLSIIFTWSNGFQHASSVAAPAIGSRSLTRTQVVLLIFVFEVLGTMCGGSAVADVVRSLSKWPEDPSILPILCSALLTATVWNFIARKFKQPASSTHSLLGALIGALIAGAGNFACVEGGKFDLVHPSGVVGAVVSLFISPLLGVIFAYLFFAALILLFFRATNKLSDVFGKMQWGSTALLAFGDGQNDTQKTMGLMVLGLNSAGYLQGHEIPLWVRAIVAISMGAGAFFMTSNLVNELARHIYPMTKAHAFAAETTGAVVLIANSLIGGPVSASQVISASIVGGAMPQRIGGVHWIVVKNILLAWLVTIPANAILAAAFYGAIFHWFTSKLAT